MPVGCDCEGQIEMAHIDGLLQGSCSVTSVLQVLDDYQKFGYVVGAFGSKQWGGFGGDSQ